MNKLVLVPGTSSLATIAVLLWNKQKVIETQLSFPYVYVNNYSYNLLCLS